MKSFVKGVEAKSAPWLELISAAVTSLDFGTINIKVHDGAVVQIETTRKIRVPGEPAPGGARPAREPLVSQG